MSERLFPARVGRRLAKVAIYVGLIIVLSLLPLFIKSPYSIHIAIMTLILIISASSLRTIAISGQISLAHAAFMGIGAYTAAVLSIELGWTPWITIPLGGLAAMAIAVLIGYSFSRLRAIYFAMVSLFFGLGTLAINSLFKEYTGGERGLLGIEPLFAGPYKVPYYYFFLGLTLFSLLALYRFESCRIGVTLKAIAQSYLAASSVGINESGYRVLALAVGCFFAGLAGAGYAHYTLVLSQSSFGLLASIYVLVYVLVGGLGSFVGPIIGTAVLIVIPEFFRGLKEFAPYIFASISIIVIFVMPQGLVGLFERTKLWVAKLREGKAVTHAS
jgi:branched-chain amino acid transport system permease protein